MKAIKIFLLIIISVSCLQAQETEWRISGTITDTLGNLLPGATVLIKGTNQGTVSDINGKYAIVIPENTILQFSYIGMKSQEIAVENRQEIAVVMEEEVPIGINPGKPINLSTKQRKKVDADNSFAFKMFMEISKLQGTNTFFSPFSLNMVMGMLYNGSSDNTRAEISKILGITNFSESEVNEYYRKISQDLLEIDPVTDIIIANSVWYRNNFQVKESFIELSRKYFDADVQPLDFSNSNAANIINNWCNNKTRGRVNHITANPISNGMMMYLTNAVYFKSKWQMEKRFDKEQTKPDNFIKCNNKKIRVNMMEQTAKLPYYADQYLQCVEIPYGNQALSMITVLPIKNMNINQLIDHLSSVKWDRIMADMKEERVWLKLPRFRIECEISLNQPLMNTGIRQIFKGGFMNISDTPLHVSSIKQKTFIEVNEEGTEAAAVTAMMIIGYGVMRTPNKPVCFFANRPFLFLIREKSTGVILFIGRIDEPFER